MTPHEKALLASSPGITVLVIGLVWWLLDPKGDARGHLVAGGVRALNQLRASARF